MSHKSYVFLIEEQLNLCTCIGIVYSFENANLLRHKSEHTCVAAIYYQVGWVTKALQCKAKYIINLKSDPTHIDAGDLILLSNLLKPWTLACASEIGAFSLEYLNL